MKNGLDRRVMSEIKHPETYRQKECWDKKSGVTLTEGETLRKVLRDLTHSERRVHEVILRRE